MKLVPKSSPYIRKNVSVKRMMLDVIIALLPVTLFAVIRNGWGAIYVLLISLVTMVLTELVAHGIMHWPEDMKLKDYILSFMEILQGIGYCCCDPSDTGYDGRYNCCGYGCDWYRPNFILEELNVIGYYNFVGNEHDLWDSIDDFVGITEKEKEEMIKKKQIDEIEEQISLLIGKLRELKS